ncbi:unnamed protein product, partial [Allacma fusca]
VDETMVSTEVYLNLFNVNELLVTCIRIRCTLEDQCADGY